MTDHDLCTLFVAQVLVRIDPSRLVLGEESRILHFPISWYKAPVRTSWLFAPTRIAASAARLATCMECWKVPGTVSDIWRSKSLLIFDSSTKVTLEVNPNVFPTGTTADKRIIAELHLL